MMNEPFRFIDALTSATELLPSFSADAVESTSIWYDPGAAPLPAVALTSDRPLDGLAPAVAVNLSNAVPSASAFDAVWNDCIVVR